MSHQLWLGFTDPEKECVTGAKTHLQSVMHMTDHVTITIWSCDSYVHMILRPLNFKKNSIVRYPSRVELGPVSSFPCEFLGRLWPGRGPLLVITTVIRVQHAP